jgi:ribosome assembly protein YihI (activator of Der GTPase)
MSTPERNESEIQRLMALIDAEYYSAFSALHSTSLGTSRHAFINAKYDRIGELSDELGQLIGKDEVMKLVIEQLDSSNE